MIFLKHLSTLASLLAFVSLIHCQKKEEQSLGDLLLNISALGFLSTANKCTISSADNTNFFVSGTTPTGGSSIVDRLDAKLPEAGTVEVYYPRGTSTNLPVVVLFQGGNVHSSFYSRYAARFASDGYVVYVANRCTTFFTQFFLKVSSALSNEVYAFSRTQNGTASSPLAGRINSELIGTIGHSLGGVTSLYANNGICQFPFCDPGSAFLSQVKVAVLYGAGLTNQLDPNRIRVDSNGKAIPVGFIQGSLDGAFPPRDGQSSYDNYKSPKFLLSLDGANHYSLTDVSAPTGANLERTASTLTQEQGIDRVSSATLLLLNAYLKNSTADLNRLQNNTSAITGLTIVSSL